MGSEMCIRDSVWPALRALGTGRPLAEALHLVATPEEAAAIVLA